MFDKSYKPNYFYLPVQIREALRDRRLKK
jgi:hypothetical protein